MSELDIEKQTIGGLRWILETTEQRGLPKVSIEVEELRAIIAALEQGEDYRLRLKAVNDAYIEVSQVNAKLIAALESRDG